MKVLMLNGSPKENGNTAIALGKETFGLPKKESRIATNSIR